MERPCAACVPSYPPTLCGMNDRAAYWASRVLGILGVLYVGALTVFDVADGLWLQAVLRVAVIGLGGWFLYRYAKRRGR